MLKKALASAIVTFAAGSLVLPAFATSTGSYRHSGWICTATDGAKQQYIDYESPTNAPGYVENTSSSLSFYVGC